MNSEEFEASVRNKIEARLVTMNSNQQIDFLVKMLAETLTESTKVIAVKQAALECSEERRAIVSHSYDTLLKAIHEAMKTAADNFTLPDELVPYYLRTCEIYAQPQMVN
ncbi:MAG: hypothetical protein ACOYBW_08775 [Fluviibacter phosphoraccumulans]